MSSKRGNVKKSGPPKHQNKTAWKNVYHDTSKRTQRIVNTEVSGVCRRCKDIIDWRIKYKKYKPLSQPKTCAMCKQKTVKKAYNTYCQTCATKTGKCAKCCEQTEIVLQPSLPPSEQAAEDKQLEFGLEMLPERKRRTFRRLQEKGMVNEEILAKYGLGDDDLDYCDLDIDDSDKTRSLIRLCSKWANYNHFLFLYTGTFRRLQDKGMVNEEMLAKYGLGDDDLDDCDLDLDDSDNSDSDISDNDQEKDEATVDNIGDSCEKDLEQLDLNKD